MPYGVLNQFFGVKARAANIGQSSGNYTSEMFREDFPQFFNADGESLVPASMLEQLIQLANTSIQPDKWLEWWRTAAGWYTAHYATLYLRTYAESNSTPAQAAASGALVGVVKSAKLGDREVTYDTSAITAGTEEWGDLNATTYGQLLANRAKLVGAAGTLFI